MKFALIACVAAASMASAAAAVDVAGSATGVFVNPQPATAVTTGSGTSNFTFGAPASANDQANRLSFTGSAFSSAFETPFKVGTLTYYNGTVTAGTEITSVNFTLATAFTQPSLGTVSNTFSLGVITTPNTGTADQNADYLNLPSTFGSNTFQIGGTTYSVALTGFGNIVGDGFLASNATQLHVRENASATADLFAVVTSRTGAVPEPASWGLFLLGFGGVGAAMRRNRAMIARFA